MQLDDDNAAAPEKVQPVWRSNVPITVKLPSMTPRLGRNLLGRTLMDALQDGIDLGQMAALAWTTPAAVTLSGTAATLLARHRGYGADDLRLDDFAPDVALGSVGEIVHAFSSDPREPITHAELREATDDFAALIKRAADLGDGKADVSFLRRARRQIEAAIRLSIRAQLFERSLWEEWTRVKTPDFSMVAEVAEHYRDYKRRCDVIDIADILAAEVQPIEHCVLALIDEAAAVPPRGLQTLRRLLPRASFVLTGPYLQLGSDG